MDTGSAPGHCPGALEAGADVGFPVHVGGLSAGRSQSWATAPKGGHWLQPSPQQLRSPLRTFCRVLWFSETWKQMYSAPNTVPSTGRATRVPCEERRMPPWEYNGQHHRSDGGGGGARPKESQPGVRGSYGQESIQPGQCC